ncbi:MAG: hypothetical protein AAGF11_05030 [Myxococcota bacterium]
MKHSYSLIPVVLSCVLGPFAGCDTEVTEPVDELDLEAEAIELRLGEAEDCIADVAGECIGEGGVELPGGGDPTPTLDKECRRLSPKDIPGGSIEVEYDKGTCTSTSYYNGEVLESSSQECSYSVFVTVTTGEDWADC